MNYAFLPDLSALTILIVVLVVLRRRHPQPQADVWLLGLSFTLIEAVAHTFYAPVGAPAKALHITVLVCYLLAGLTFTWASGDDRAPRRNRLVYLCLNALPLLAIDILYGLHIYQASAYLPAIAAGLVLGVATSLYLQKSSLLALSYLVGWVGIALLVRKGDFREAVYWSLCCVYLLAGLNFGRRLPQNSTGRIAILTGFSIWSLCFLLHPWIVHYREYADIASHVWNMQKSLISIGMLLVMLERQVDHNQWLARHDELTGLPNRRLFEERIAAALPRCREEKRALAMFLLDLNGFKKINDSRGHHVGDQVLKELAGNLRQAVDSTATLARLGGDEFVLIACEGKQTRNFDHIAQSIRHAVERPMTLEGEIMAVSASLGVATFPEDGADAAELLRVADQRMYLLKQRSAMREELKAGLAANALAQD